MPRHARRCSARIIRQVIAGARRAVRLSDDVTRPLRLVPIALPTSSSRIERKVHAGRRLRAS